MKCPFCKRDSDKVIDSRPLEEASVIRRRRKCLKCERRFTTYERLEQIPLIVIKNDKRRESFNRDKLREGIIRACEKRPISIEIIENIVNEIEYELRDYVMEVKSRVIGEKVLKKLKALDEVAYVRFASVYRKFKSTSAFIHELQTLKRLQKSNPQRKSPN